MTAILEMVRGAAGQVAIGLAGLSLLVFIHELGHFLAAKWAGVRVNTFAIGFGKTLWGFRRGDTQYCLKAFPFGGFVAMAGEQPGEEPTGDAMAEFRRKPVAVRMGIAVAGPLFNVLFSVAALFCLFVAGIQEPVSSGIEVGEVIIPSPAEKAGLLAGDKVISMQGRAVDDMDRFLQDIAVSAGKPLALRIQRAGNDLQLTLVPEMHKMGFAWAGLIPGRTHVEVAALASGWPAAAAGFKKGDRVISAAGVKVPDSRTFIDLISGSKGIPLEIVVSRQGRDLSLPVAARLDPSDGKYRIGMNITTVFLTPTHLVKRSPGQALSRSLQKNVEYAALMGRFFTGLLRGQVKLKAMSGPVGILQVIGSSFRQSLQKFVEFLALISLNLGLVNLLPLVITDGGVLLFLVVEAIRRRPLGEALQARINQAAIAFFIALAVFITFQDILRFPLFLD